MPASYTYDPTTLSTDPLMRVRRIVGDVSNDPSSTTLHLADEEILFAIDQAVGNEYAAAVELLEQLSTQFADKATVSAGSQKIQLSDVAKAYAERAAKLAARYGVGNEGATISALTLEKVDGYSSNIPADAVGPTRYGRGDIDEGPLAGRPDYLDDYQGSWTADDGLAT